MTWERTNRLGSIPACAGETKAPFIITKVLTVYPRLCGGNDVRPVAHKIELGLSPLVRGKLSPP